MKVRNVRNSGYENGAALAKAWEAEGLQLSVTGEVIEGGYRFVRTRLAHRQQQERCRSLAQEQLEEWKGAGYGQISALGGSDEEILDHVATLHLRALPVIADAAKYREVQGLPEYVVEEAKGIAEYWGADHRRVLLCRDTYRRLINLMVAGPRTARAAPACTTIAFRSSARGPIIGRNMDSGLDALPGLEGYGEPVLYRYPEGMGYSSISVAQINSRGLTIQGSGMAYPDEPALEAGYEFEVYDLVLRFCSTVDEAIEIITRYSPFIHPSNLLVCDADGNAAVIEKTKHACGIRRPGTASTFTTSGVVVEEASRQHLDTTSPGYRSNLLRHQRIARHVGDLELRMPSVGEQEMWGILQDMRSPGPVWRHPGNQPPGELTTLYSFVLVPGLMRYQFRLADTRGRPPAGTEPQEHAYAFA
jgi:hypothetical protein